MKRLCLLGIIAILAAAIQPARADTASWPERPVRIISAYPPGGASDNITRLVAAHLTTALGQTFVVVNRPGAGGMIGTAAVAKAKNDGYTLLLSPSGPFATALPFFKNIGFDPARDFSAISYVGHYEMAMVPNAQTPFRPVAELVAYTRANPGKVRFAVPTIGGIPHLTSELFQWKAGLQGIKVPYKGSSEALTDLAAGHIDVDVDSMPALMQMIHGNRLLPLAVTAEQRLEALPDVPTFKELGYPDLVAYAWLALLTPAGTPAPIIDKLARTMKQILADPAVVAQFRQAGARPEWRSAADTDRFIREEVARWQKVVDDANVLASFPAQ